MTGPLGHKRPAPSRSNRLPGGVILWLFVYALGLIPFYFLTPVRQILPDIPTSARPSTPLTPSAPGRAPGGNPGSPAASGDRAPASSPVAAAATVTPESPDNSGSPSSLVVTATPDSALADWILYGANGDLWETDGAQTIQLTHNGHLSQPAVDANVLVYVERQKDHSDLWLAQPRAAPRRITHNASADVTANHWVAAPAILAGGRRVYVLSDLNKSATGAGDLAIWSLDLPSGTPRQITQPQEYTGGDQDIALRPRDPDTLVFTRYTYANNSQLVEGLVWLTVSADKTTALTSPDHPARQPSFAPDGKSIAFVQTDGPADNLYVGRIDSSPLPRLADVGQAATGTIAQPVWSPDGTQLAYLMLTNRQFQLWARPISRAADGTFVMGTPRQITHGDGVDAASRPVWLSGATAAAVPSWLKSAR